MRAFSPLSSLVLVSAAALLAPLGPAVPAAATGAVGAGSAADPHATRVTPVVPTGERDGEPRLPGSTRSVPLGALAARDGAAGGPGAPGEHGLTPRAVPPFSLVGVVWPDASRDLGGTVRVRTRDARSGRWSPWRELTAQADHAPGPFPAEAAGDAAHAAGRGATAPLWVGRSDGVQVRVRPHPGRELPSGLRLELVDPGEARGTAGRTDADDRADGRATDRADDGAGTAPDAPRGAAPQDPHATAPDQPGGTRLSGPPGSSGGPSRTGADGDRRQGPPLMLPPLNRAETEADARAAGMPGVVGTGDTDAAGDETAADAEGDAEGDAAADDGGSHIGPRPGIVIRRGWGADEGMRKGGYKYADTVKAAFVHHTAGSNDYRCSEARSVIRGIYRYHVRSQGWRDIGYNFLVDKCGTIYEGRAGGVREPVQGAHTYGFNQNSMGVAVLGSFGKTDPPRKALEGVAKLTGWKLGLYGVNPKGSTRMKSGGKSHRVRTISGHRDAFSTACPGDRLYRELGFIRDLAARLQGR
ncbi:peptidoglycan recognition protein [Streptomyces sp. JJ36]|uniref:peptidoglycan recognition protein family protein n=1 Tax=Streptomyces sp. JJ36 TaxID=2736645 RepID=UPI001F435113|nr:peptidoglycan recognition protein [Streptomyces sp. JJ36]